MIGRRGFKRLKASYELTRRNLWLVFRGIPANYNPKVILRIRACSLWMYNLYGRQHFRVGDWWPVERVASFSQVLPKAGIFLPQHLSFLCPAGGCTSPASFLLSVFGRAQAARRAGWALRALCPAPFFSVVFP